MAQEKIQVFAVVRIDESTGGDASADDLQNRITVKEIVATQVKAEEEVRRLNQLNAEKGARYFSQATRYFPDV